MAAGQTAEIVLTNGSEVGKPTTPSDATIGVPKRQQELNADDLEWVLGECKWQMNNTTRFASLSACIAALDPSGP